MKKWLLLFINVVCIHATNQVQPVNTKNRTVCRAGKHTYEKFNPQLEEIREEELKEESDLDESGYSSDPQTPLDLRSITTLANENPNLLKTFMNNYLVFPEQYKLESLEGLPEFLEKRFPHYKYLSFKGLKDIPKNSFNHQNMESLESLSLTDGNLKILPKKLLKPLTNLKYLYLSNNGLTHLPQGFFSDLPSLKYIDLSGNNFSENEQIKILQETNGSVIF